jgi:hypothetical protein
MLAAVDEFQRELIVEGTREGLAAARARGRTGGRPSKMTDAQIALARQLYDGKQHTVQQIADMFHVTKPHHLPPPRGRAGRSTLVIVMPSGVETATMPSMGSGVGSARVSRKNKTARSRARRAIRSARRTRAGRAARRDECPQPGHRGSPPRPAHQGRARGSRGPTRSGTSLPGYAQRQRPAPPRRRHQVRRRHGGPGLDMGARGPPGEAARGVPCQARRPGAVPER